MILVVRLNLKNLLLNLKKQSSVQNLNLRQTAGISLRH